MIKKFLIFLLLINSKYSFAEYYAQGDIIRYFQNLMNRLFPTWFKVESEKNFAVKKIWKNIQNEKILLKFRD